jgi:hypothetical protein
MDVYVASLGNDLLLILVTRALGQSGRTLSGRRSVFLDSAAVPHTVPSRPGAERSRSQATSRTSARPAFAKTRDALRSGLRERHELSGCKAPPASGSRTSRRSASFQILTPTVSPAKRGARSLGETAARSAASGGIQARSRCRDEAHEFDLQRYGNEPTAGRREFRYPAPAVRRRGTPGPRRRFLRERARSVRRTRGGHGAWP